MTTVRISGNWRNPNKKEWAGAPDVDSNGHIARTIDIPEEAYQAIERALTTGNPEGTVYLADGTRFDWFLERDSEGESSAPPPTGEALEADRLQAIAARDQLWASLRPLLPEIEHLAQGHFDNSDRQRQMIQLIARIVSNELRFRAGDM
jgi:hypothetical protein